VNLVLGTAGHIDHGKTALVKALTGIDTDRLPVEKKRGITTELGFAHFDLAGRRIAVVDVPGHERFVKSMVAGAAGLDLVCLVIAADEGIMPQTREHLDICQLLGVGAGLVALTKRDLVDDEWLAMVDAELRDQLAGTFLAAAPIVPVSARTGAGLDELRAAITTIMSTIPPRPTTGAFRLPIDRVFTIKGFGTVVTGTIWGGTVARDDELVVLPRGLATRARGVEVHGAAADRASAGQRAAINVPGLAVDELARGDVLSHPDALEPSHILDVRFTHVRAARGPLPDRARVLLHHGTAQVTAVLRLADGPLAPGATGLGQLRVDASTPLAALPGDRFIVRGFVPLAHHGTTLGGGEILRAQASKLRAPDQLRTVAALDGAPLANRLAFEVKASAAAGLTAAGLGQRVGRHDLAASLEALVAHGELVAVGDAFLHAETIAALEQRALDALDASPTRVLGREELRSKLPTALPTRGLDVIVDGLVRRGSANADGDAVRRERRAAVVTLSPLEQTLVEKFRAWGVSPPSPKELSVDAAAKQALDRLLVGGQVVKIKPDLYVAAEVAADLRARLLAHLEAHGQITPQEWKDLTGATRKYSIPLAEYFDGEKVTLRVGDVRRRRG